MPGIPFPTTTASQPQSAESGKLFGIEVNAQRRLTFLPAPFDGFGVSVNGTDIGEPDLRVAVEQQRGAA